MFPGRIEENKELYVLLCKAYSTCTRSCYWTVSKIAYVTTVVSPREMPWCYIFTCMLFGKTSHRVQYKCDAIIFRCKMLYLNSGGYQDAIIKYYEECNVQSDIQFKTNATNGGRNNYYQNLTDGKMDKIIPIYHPFIKGGYKIFSTLYILVHMLYIVIHCIFVYNLL